MNRKKEPFTTFRHIRPLQKIKNYGTITVCVTVFPKDQKLQLGFSFCSPKDQFVKKIGRDEAQRRHDFYPIEIEHNEKVSLADNALDYLAKCSLKKEKIPYDFKFFPKWIRSNIVMAAFEKSFLAKKMNTKKL